MSINKCKFVTIKKANNLIQMRFKYEECSLIKIKRQILSRQYLTTRQNTRITYSPRL